MTCDRKHNVTTFGEQQTIPLRRNRSMVLSKALGLDVISTRARNGSPYSPFTSSFTNPSWRMEGAGKINRKNMHESEFQQAEGAAHITSGPYVDTFLGKLSRWSNALLFSEKELGVQILRKIEIHRAKIPLILWKNIKQFT